LLILKGEDLQGMLDVVHRWCCTWQIQVNPVKPRSFISVTKGKSFSDFVFFYRLPIQKVYTCANRALGVVIATAKAAHGFPLSVFSHLYEACVIPICAYSAHVWANRKRQSLEKIQKQCSDILFWLRCCHTSSSTTWGFRLACNSAAPAVHHVEVLV